MGEDADQRDSSKSHVAEALVQSVRAQFDEEGPVAGSALAKVVDDLAHAFGTDFRYYKPNTVARRLARRIELTQCVDLEAYATRLESQPDELARLFNDLLIGVSAFFRDPTTFERLDSTIVPALLDSAADREQLRVWVPACAKGEEAYSLAILIDEHLQRRGQSIDVRIFASDLHKAAVQHASVGSYPAEALEGVSRERREHYFVRSGDSYRVVPKLRDMMVFAPHDLLREPPFTQLDLISCRNLLIYLRDRTQERVLSTLTFALRTGGYLVLGASETPRGGVALVEESAAHRIYRKSGTGPLAIGHVAPRSFTPTPPAPPRLAERTQFLESLLAQLGPSGLVVDAQGELVHSLGDAGLLLKQPAGPVSRDVLRMTGTELSATLSVCLRRAKELAQAVDCGCVRLDAEREAEVAVEPLSNGFFFVRVGAIEARQAAPRPVLDAGQQSLLEAQNVEVERLRAQLQMTNSELVTRTAELHAANEELVAANEELQGTNEELHSLNEELRSVNVDHQAKIHALTQATRDLHNLHESIDVATLFLDRETCVRQFNQAMASVVNLLPQDVGRPIRHLACPLQFVETSLAEVCERALIQNTTVEVSATAEGRHYLVHARPYRTEHGQADGVVVTAANVTTLRQAMHRLESAEERFRLFSEQSRDVLWIIGPGPDDLYVSAAFQQVFGLDPSTRAQRDGPMWWLDLAIAEDRALLEKADQELWTTGRLDVEYRIARPDGQERWIRTRGVRVDTGDPAKFVRLGISEDVTERKQRNALAHGALEAAPDAMLIVSADGRIEFCNSQAIRLFGHPRETLLSMRVEDLIPHARRENHAKLRASYGENAEPRAMGQGRIFDCLRADGSTAPVELSLGPVRLADGLRVCAVVRDASKRLEDEKSAMLRAARNVQAQRLEAIGRLSGGVAHDFNNALTAIMSFTSFAIESLPSESPARTDLAEVIRAARSASQLTASLLAFARQQRVQPEVFDINAAVERTRALLERTLGEHIALHSLLADEPLLVEMDPGQLEQVILNLTVNARDAMPNGGLLTIATSACQMKAAGSNDDVPGAELWVRDTGGGIPPAVLTRVFEPFFSTKGERGTGLGLATCFGIVSQAGGKIEVDSRVDRGTTFTIRLPLSTAPATIAQGEEPPLVVHSSARKGLVFVVEDQEGIRNSVERALRAAGHEVETFDAAEPAIARVDAGEVPLLVVSDVVLPGLSGVELARRLRRRLPELPILWCSGYLGEDLPEVLHTDAYTAFLPKPFTPRDVVERCAQLLSGADVRTPTPKPTGTRPK